MSLLRVVQPFHASGVGVCELFAQGLGAQEVTTRHSQLRLFLHDDVERDDVAVEVFDSGEGYEGGCPGASAVADLTASPGRRWSWTCSPRRPGGWRRCTGGTPRRSTLRALTSWIGSARHLVERHLRPSGPS